MKFKKVVIISCFFFTSCCGFEGNSSCGVDFLNDYKKIDDNKEYKRKVYKYKWENKNINRSLFGGSR
jgi:hypothetical protein